MIVSVGNNKGGVGKTSITCNLAAALGRLGAKVLVLDMDSQCNATSILLSGESHIATHTMYDLLDPDIREGIHGDTFVVSTRHPNVSCIPNIEESSALDIPLGRSSPDSFRILQQRLPHVLSSKPFDVVLIDNPPSIGLWLTISLAASDFAIVPIDAASGYSLDGLRKVLDLIDTIRENINPALRFLRLVVNRADQRTLIARHVIERIRTEFSGQYFETIIPMATLVQQAEYLHRTVFEQRSNSKAAKAYRSLAREFLEILKTS